ncbi:MAG TPA: [NiFe]-hydrogenase assembly chaperone HybE [Hyphomicrobiales bacterium]|nr:[NiFe]-hydrogenase assembly chaperone HybE [Kaistiaceae bacterium]HQF29836.1 [NiFe]-hydrogenase assembly chaperone HybE [Hyphomicrobiales bacterium]
MTLADDPSREDLRTATLERKVGVLVRRFRIIAEGMRDLPLCNPAIAVEAVDFRIHDGEGVGVLITPWFMNVVLLPLDDQPFEMAAMGRKRLVEMPAGPREFLVGGDEVTGLFAAHSLHSPILDVSSHDAAVAVARSALDKLMTPPPEEDEAIEPEAQSEASPQPGTSRRTLLFGRR